jgi:hypothetical protein
MGAGNFGLFAGKTFSGPRRINLMSVSWSPDTTGAPFRAGYEPGTPVPPAWWQATQLLSTYCFAPKEVSSSALTELTKEASDIAVNRMVLWMIFIIWSFRVDCSPILWA